MNRKDMIIPAVPVLLYLLLTIPLMGSVIDDTYIHYQYARNLAEDCQLAFNSSVPSYGATSPLWVFLLALFFKAGLPLEPVSHFLGHLFAAASIILVYFYVLRIGGKREAAGAAALLLSVEGWLLRWSSVGMESSFAVFMVMALLFLSLGSMKSVLRSVIFGITLAAASLARPEILLMVPISIIYFILIKREKLILRIAWLAAFALLYGGWLLIAKSHTGTFFPLTAGAKQGWSFLSIHALRRMVLPVKIIGATLLLPVVFSLLWLLLKGGRLREKNRFSHPLFLPASWALSLPVVYVIFDFNILSRYLLPVSPAVIVLGVLALEELLAGMARSRGLVFRILVAAAMIQNLAFYFIVVVPPTVAFSRGVREVLVPMGKWLEVNTPEESVVATPDIGAVGFYSEREVLDLGGLVTPWINRMRDSLSVDKIIRDGYFLREKCDYLIDRDFRAERLKGNIAGGMEYVPVTSDTVPNLGIRRQKPVVYTLYLLRPVD
ncbi:MAG: glycosyltransferase family 39 protein [Candidatus Krumholzibacteriales bacterium]